MPKITLEETTPLKWPDGYGRTLINNRKTQTSWKRQFSFYRESLIKELERMKIVSATISRNTGGIEKQDPGVALWFSLKPTDDFSWQTGLQLDNPAPSLDEIDTAFRRLAQKHHPDAVANGSGGDIQTFLKLSEYRKKARAWILGQNAPAHNNCIPMDLFTDARQNLAALCATLRHIRGLERLGMPTIVERVMTTAFKTALPENVEKRKEPVAV